MTRSGRITICTGRSQVPSNKQRGDAHELEVVKILEADGWKVFKQHRKIVGMVKTPKGLFPRMAGADIFGCDIIAKRKGDLTKWIQVSVDGAKSKKEDQLNEFYWDTDHESVEIWLRVKGKKTYRVFLLKRVDLQGGGQGQQFVEAEHRSLRPSPAKASNGILPGGAGFIR